MRARLELVESAVGLLADHLDRVRNVLVVEGRQHDHARAPMELAVDRQKTVAHQPDEVSEVALAPGEVGRVRHRDVVVRRRTQHEHHVGVEQAQREDRTEVLVCVKQHRQRFRGEAARARQRHARFTRRERDRRRALVAQVFEQHRERLRVHQRRRALERHGLEPSEQTGRAASLSWSAARRRARASIMAASNETRGPSVRGARGRALSYWSERADDGVVSPAQARGRSSAG